MSTRERLLAYVLLGVILVVGVGFFGYLLYLSPLRDRETRLASLSDELDKKGREIEQIQRDLPRLERWKQLSLPTDLDLARREYERYLTLLLRESGFDAGSYTITPPRGADTKTPTAAQQAKGPPYTRLSYTLKAPATITQVVAFMERFYRTPLLHQIHRFTLKRTTNSAQAGKLDFDLTIEALVLGVPESKGRPVAYIAVGSGVWAARTVNRVPINTLANTPPRDYGSIAARNIFLGPPPARAVAERDRTDLTQMIYLTDITVGSGLAEASLAYRYRPLRNQFLPISLKPDEDTFPILEDSQGRPLVEGSVKAVEERELIFRVQLATERDRVPMPRGGRGRREDADLEHFTRPDPKVVEGLIRDGAIEAADADRIFMTGRAYWDQLIREEMVTVRGPEFAFKSDLVCGQVVRTPDQIVLLEVNEKYCAYAGNSENRVRRRRPEPHAGYFTYQVGQSLDQAMEIALSEGQLKELLKSVALPKREEESRP